MAFLGKTSNVLRKLRRDESGITSISWTLSIAVILGAMGAAMDIAILSNADSRSQAIADNTALSAAIYVKNNDRPPTEEGELTDGKHTAASLGYEYKSFVEGGANGVDVTITYDDNAKHVTTTVTGKTNPILVQFLGVHDTSFSATSVVSYLDIDNKFPASIALVLDNSGSMQFDDKPAINIEPFTHPYGCKKEETVWKRVRNRRGRWRWVQVTETYDATCYYTHDHGEKAPGAEIRLVGLKKSVVKFQTDLKSRLGVEDDSGRKTLRMGMLPYSSAIIAAGEQPMDWGYLAEGSINHVNNNANPSDDVDVAQGIYTMRADGGTNSSPPMSEVETWMDAEDSIHTEEAVRTQTDDIDPLKFVIFMTDGQNSVGTWTFIPGITGKFHKQTSSGHWSTSSTAQSGYTEGTLRRTADIETEEACTRMKADEITVFTIGYALEDFGRFRVNGWNGHENDYLYTISSDVQTAAFNLMRNCASSPEHFIKAADADQLEAAFDEIQNAIVEELIRVKA